jgi:hypothetical protein
VLFSPTTSGAASGSVSITSTGANPNLSIPLAGKGVTPGTLTANPTSLAFASVQVGNSTSLSETLTNSGGLSLTISAATVATDSDERTVLAFDVPTRQRNASCANRVTVKPTHKNIVGDGERATVKQNSPTLSSISRSLGPERPRASWRYRQPVSALATWSMGRVRRSTAA